MKLHALMIAVALAAGSAFAQAPSSTYTAPADSGKMSAGETMDKAPAKVQKKKVAKKKVQKHEMQKHASGKQRQHAKAGMTQAMGAGVASPATDLDAKARQDRIDQAYANWRAKQ
jgi:hypothetical protein